MAKRSSKTVAQQCRYYEVDNIFVYMVETYINGNISVFRELYRELNKDARRDFTDFLLSKDSHFQRIAGYGCSNLYFNPYSSSLL